MIKSILPATILSSLVISAAWAAPISPNQVNEYSSTNLVHVGYYDKKYYKKNKKYYKDHGYYHGGPRYYHGGRYYGHRYYARPPGWQTLGCFAAGPVWYCP